MIIKEFRYDEERETLYVDFLKNDDDINSTEITFTIWDIDYYSTDLIERLGEMDEDFVIEIVNRYLNENELIDDQK